MNTSVINLFPSQCGLRKGYSSQQSLLVMTEKFKESIDEGNTSRALLTYISKVFDCIDHTFLIAKFFAFAVLPLSLKLVDTLIYQIKLNESKSMKILVI